MTVILVNLASMDMIIDSDMLCSVAYTVNALDSSE